MTGEETRKGCFARDVTNNMAREAFRQYHQALYNSGKKPCLSIPVDPSDADVVLGDYLRQQAGRESELASARREIAGLRTGMQNLIDDVYEEFRCLCDPDLDVEGNIVLHAAKCPIAEAERLLSGDKSGAQKG